ncbi:MAG: DUF3987 domain-containing protein, partial [Planctomycetaceae bacterium]|nr:DUF3987 domain-containing protein [Planctomycetaceae bacterium]
MSLVDQYAEEFDRSARRNGSSPEQLDIEPAEHQQEPSLPRIPFKPFPDDCLPGVIASYVREVAVSIGCDVTYAALPMLSVLAACIGRSRQLEVKPGWWEPSVIWSAIIGESGTGKSPAFDAILRPLRKLEDRMLEEYRAECDRILTTEAELGKGRKKEPNLPPMPRYSVADTTIEALGPILQDNPLGLLLADDELSGWLGSFNQYKSGKGSDRSKWLQTYNAGRLVIDRKTGIRVLIIPHASVCICGGIQPGILRKSFSDEDYDSGLPARFLLAMPPDKITGWTDNPMPDDTEYQQVLERLINDRTPDFNLGFENGTIPDSIQTIRLSSQAREVIASFKDGEKERLVGISDPLRASWAKSAGRAARMALLLHCVESPESDRVTGDVMQRAVVLAQWFDREIERVYHNLGVCQSGDSELLG